MLHVFKLPAFRNLYAATVFALLGTGLTTVALSLTAYAIDPRRASFILGAILVVKMVAYVAVAPIAHAIFRGYEPKTVLVASEIVRIGTIGCLPFVNATWQVLLLVFLLQAASAAYTPTLQALLPRVIQNQDQYTDALSWTRIASDAEMLLSPTVAAALLLFIPRQSLFDVAAGALLLSVATLFCTAAPRKINEQSDDAAVQSALDGYRVFFRYPALRPVLLVNLSVAMAVAVVLVQTVVIVQTDLGMTESSVGVFLAINGAGSLSAATVMPRLLRRFGLQRIIWCGTVLLPAGLVLASLVLSPLFGGSGFSLQVSVIALGWFGIGIGWSLAETPLSKLIAAHVPEGTLPAAFAAQFSLSHACWLIGYGLVGLLGVAGSLTVIVIMIVISIFAAVGTWVMFNRTQCSKRLKQSQCKVLVKP